MHCINSYMPHGIHVRNQNKVLTRVFKSELPKTYKSPIDRRVLLHVNMHYRFAIPVENSNRDIISPCRPGLIGKQHFVLASLGKFWCETKSKFSFVFVFIMQVTRANKEITELGNSPLAYFLGLGIINHDSIKIFRVDDLFYCIPLGGSLLFEFLDFIIQKCNLGIMLTDFFLSFSIHRKLVINPSRNIIVNQSLGTFEYPCKSVIIMGWNGIELMIMAPCTTNGHAQNSFA